MTIYILDTDTITLYQRQTPVVVNRVLREKAAGHTLGLAITTIDEQSSGWITALRKARTPADLATASRSFAEAVRSWKPFEIYPTSEPALSVFDQLRRLKLNIGSNDLRIAAIALDLGATVVTCNRRDFGRVPNLPIEDWSV